MIQFRALSLYYNNYSMFSCRSAQLTTWLDIYMNRVHVQKDAKHVPRCMYETTVELYMDYHYGTLPWCTRSQASQTFSVLEFHSYQLLHVLGPTWERSLKATWMGTSMVACPAALGRGQTQYSTQHDGTCQSGDMVARDWQPAGLAQLGRMWYQCALDLDCQMKEHMCMLYSSPRWRFIHSIPKVFVTYIRIRFVN